MWGNYQFLILLTSFGFILLTNTKSLIEFAVFSEVTWLCIYSLTAALGSLVNDVAIYAYPFIILVVTATEAIIVWILVTYQLNLVKL